VASFYQDNSVFQNSITIMAVLSRLLSYCCIQRDQEPSFTDKSLSKAGLADEIVAKLFAAQKNDAAIITLIALGVVALMVPWLMAYLGFAEEGIIEGNLMLLTVN